MNLVAGFEDQNHWIDYLINKLGDIYCSFYSLNNYLTLERNFYFCFSFSNYFCYSFIFSKYGQYCTGSFDHDTSLILFIRWGMHLYMSVPSICLSICRAPYLRKCASSDYNSWYTYVKWWYLHGFFHFLKFWFFGLLGPGKKKKNSPKWKIKITSVTQYISGAV